MDGVLFVYKVKEINTAVQTTGPKITVPTKNEPKSLVKSKEPVKKVQDEVLSKGLITIPVEEQLRIDSVLAEIVLVSKSKMEEWRRE
jgi:hypothetical protein